RGGLCSVTRAELPPRANSGLRNASGFATAGTVGGVTLATSTWGLGTSIGGGVTLGSWTWSFGVTLSLGAGIFLATGTGFDSCGTGDSIGATKWTLSLVSMGFKTGAMKEMLVVAKKTSSRVCAR